MITWACTLCYAKVAWNLQQDATEKLEQRPERRSQRHSPRGKLHAPWSRVCPRWRMRHKPESEGPSASRHQ